MKDNILSKKEINELYKLHKGNLSSTLKCYHRPTYDFIDKKYFYKTEGSIINKKVGRRNKFTEKIYQYVTNESGICIWCKCNPTHFRSFSEGYHDFCSQSCQQKHTASKYGVNNLFQSDKIKRKIKKTCIEKYGTDNFTKTKEYKVKCGATKMKRYGRTNYNNSVKNVTTCLERYGVTNPNKLKSVRLKIKKTTLKRYGVDSFTKTEEYREKTLQTNLRKYGVRNINQLESFQQELQKKSVRFKTYIFPPGNEIKVQGYEPFALNFLLKTHTEYDLVTNRKDIPKFWYTTEDNKKRIYYPDIFIPSTNTIVETKSEWTNSVNPTLLQLKKLSVIVSGYNFRKMIFDRKGNLLSDKLN